MSAMVKHKLELGADLWYILLFFVSLGVIHCDCSSPFSTANIEFGKYMEGCDLMAVYGVSLHRCLCECEAKDNCLAINYQRSGLACKLKDANHETASGKLVTKPGWNYASKTGEVQGCDRYTDMKAQFNQPFNQTCCGKPGDSGLPNVKILGNQYTVGRTVKYVCDNGALKSVLSTCQENGKWSHIEEFDCNFTLGWPCTTDDNCMDGNSTCRNGGCWCNPGYNYNNTEHTCKPDSQFCTRYFLSGPNPVPDGQLSESSHDGNERFSVRNGRLNWTTYGWVAEKKDKNEYVQVDLITLTTIRAIATQGRLSNGSDVTDNTPRNHYVKSYTVSYSLDGVTFLKMSYYNRTEMIFRGNRDKLDVVVNYLPCPLETRYVRIHPEEWHDHPAMRFDVIGCTLPATVSNDCSPDQFREWHLESDAPGNFTLQWKIHDGKNSILEPLPRDDHGCFADDNSSYYCYLMPSQFPATGIARILQNIRKSACPRCLELWTRASPRFQGSLNIGAVICQGEMETLTTQMFDKFDDSWKKISVDIGRDVYRIVIEGIWNKDSFDYLAIDHILLEDRSCSA